MSDVEMAQLGIKQSRFAKRDWNENSRLAQMKRDVGNADNLTNAWAAQSGQGFAGSVASKKSIRKKSRQIQKVHPTVRDSMLDFGVSADQ